MKKCILLLLVFLSFSCTKKSTILNIAPSMNVVTNSFLVIETDSVNPVLTEYTLMQLNSFTSNNSISIVDVTNKWLVGDTIKLQ